MDACWHVTQATCGHDVVYFNVQAIFALWIFPPFASVRVDGCLLMIVVSRCRSLDSQGLQGVLGEEIGSLTGLQNLCVYFLFPFLSLIIFSVERSES